MHEQRIGVMSDVHGEHQMLERVLDACHHFRVERIVLLGDLFDRAEQVERCVSRLSNWAVDGVIGNHEREALEHCLQQSDGANVISRVTSTFYDRFYLDDALFIHDELDWCSSDVKGAPRIIFAGHTHFRKAQDQHGPIDISLGLIQLRDNRRYLINPGAVVDGQFAIWDRERAHVIFERV